MKSHKASSGQRVVFKGTRIEVVNQDKTLDDKTITFEWGQRPPGVRILAVNESGQILLTKEYRHELDDYDYRLPGGKVADTLEEWHAIDDISEAAKAKAVAEGREEAGLIIKSLEEIEVVPDGATFKWDLHYFFTHDFEVTEQELEHGEDITTGWYDKSEVLEMVKKKQIREGRSVYILMPLLLSDRQ